MLVKKRVLFVVLATSLPQLATSASFDWAVRIGGASGDVTSEGIASDGAGGSLVTGEFEGTVSFGLAALSSAGSTDVFVAHMTSTGTVEEVSNVRICCERGRIEL